MVEPSRSIRLEDRPCHLLELQPRLRTLLYFTLLVQTFQYVRYVATRTCFFTSAHPLVRFSLAFIPLALAYDHSRFMSDTSVVLLNRLR